MKERKDTDRITLVKREKGNTMKIEKKKILVVEDNEINLEIMTDMLDCSGFAVEGAMDGKEALDKLASAAEGEFDLVLMDIHMPVMSGIEATKAIRSLKEPLCNIPILAMTGDSMSEDKERAKSAGMNGFITKPATIEQIMEMIGEML